MATEETMDNIIISDYTRYIGSEKHNSYLIIDNCVIIIDAVPEHCADKWLSNIEKELSDKHPDYIVITVVEMGCIKSIETLLGLYPDIKILTNEENFAKLTIYLENDDIIEDKFVEIGTNFEECIGETILNFYTITSDKSDLELNPTVPPIISYLTPENILFSSDVSINKINEFVKKMPSINPEQICPITGDIV